MCIAAATGYVNDTLSAPGVADIVDFDFIPWGNAYFATVTGNTTYDRGPGMTDWLTKCGMGVTSPPSGCFSGPILCQHGFNECKGNLIEGCVKQTLNDVVADYWPFMACFEDAGIDRVNPDSPIKAMDKCFTKVGAAKATIAAVKECVSDSKASAAVLSKNAALTAALVPAHEGTPWILVDGKALSGDNLLKAVCEAYQGAKPAGCAGAARPAAILARAEAAPPRSNAMC